GWRRAPEPAGDSAPRPSGDGGYALAGSLPAAVRQWVRASGEVGFAGGTGSDGRTTAGQPASRGCWNGRASRALRLRPGVRDSDAADRGRRGGGSRSRVAELSAGGQPTSGAG